MEEMINSVNKIISECNNQIHSFFWKFIKSEIKDENIKIILKEGKKYDTFGIKITKSNKYRATFNNKINFWEKKRRTFCSK